MSKLSVSSAAVAVLILASCQAEPVDQAAPVATSGEESRVETGLPAPALMSALEGLPVDKPDRTVVSLRTSSFPEESYFAAIAGPDAPVAVPVQARRQVVLQLRPETSAEDIQSLLETYGLAPVQTLPQIGVLVVGVPNERVENAGLALEEVAGIQSLELNELVDELAKDPRILVATPNSVLSPFVMHGSVSPVDVAPPSASLQAERQDWGIDDARIDDAWPLINGPMAVGVIDVGFGRHDDLDMREGFSVPPLLHNHGTHVAGIMCAKHNNGWVRGALPGCTVFYSPGHELLDSLDPVEGTDVVAWSALLSEYLATVLEFMDANPAIGVINLSLGYNWLPNFNQDPRSNRTIRNIVRSQGRIYKTLLEHAALKDVALVSAAGNDSMTLPTPLEAQWASPFNYGADLMLRDRGWSNGLVVEAHDRAGRRASFSNAAGHISCPGVGIVSTLASPQNGIGTMSGTSMASPYCAAGLAALRAVLPGLGLQEAMRCIRESPVSSGNVPRLDLAHAIDSCRASAVVLGGLADGYDSQKMPSLAGRGADPCAYSHSRSFAVSAVYDQGDGQGPEFADAAARQEIADYAAQLVASGCRAPVMIVTRLTYNSQFRPAYDFALGVTSVLRQAGYPGESLIVEWPATRPGAPGPNFDDHVVVMVGDSAIRGALQTSLDAASAAGT